jgi:hypothetical protein
LGKSSFREFLSAETINKVVLKDAVTNYKTNSFPEMPTWLWEMSIRKSKKMVETFGSWAKGIAPQITYPDPTNVQSQINFVDMPNAVQSEISVVNTINLKLTDKQYFAAILANQILGGGGRKIIFKLT